jgi:hypothetical protein
MCFEQEDDVESCCVGPDHDVVVMLSKNYSLYQMLSPISARCLCLGGDNKC